MRLFTNYKNWWSSLTSTFIGSLLGIGITFGISDYIQNKQQKEIERKMMITTVCDIDEQCRYLDEECKRYASLDSLFVLMNLHYMEGWKGVFPKDKMEEYYNAVSYRESSLSNKFDDIENEEYEIKTFSNNSDLVSIFRDPSTIYAIKDILSMIEFFKSNTKILNNMINGIIDYDFKYKTYEMPDYEKHFIEYQFKYEGEKRNEQILDYNIWQESFKARNKKLQTEWPLIKEKLGITDDDIRAAKSHILLRCSIESLTSQDSIINRYGRAYDSELKRIEAEKQSSSKEKTKSK